MCSSLAGMLRGNPQEELRSLNNPVINYLNGFGFRPEVCLQILKLKDSPENYAIWRKCLKCVDLLGDSEAQRITARLCLLLIGAKQINRVPGHAAGLRSIIGEWLRFSHKADVYGILTRSHRKLIFLISQEMYGVPRRLWKVRIQSGNFNRRADPNFRRIHSSFDLGSEEKTESNSSRKIPKYYPRTQ